MGMKKTYYLLLLLAGLVGGITAVIANGEVTLTGDVKKADLQKQVAGLKDDVNRLNGKVDDLNTKISKLEDQLGAKEKEIKELKSKIKE